LPPRSGDSAKAVDGGLEIIDKGTVVKHYLMYGKEKKLTYTCAIHTPTLNANLISVGAFDKAGLTVTFGDVELSKRPTELLFYLLNERNVCR